MNRIVLSALMVASVACGSGSSGDASLAGGSAVAISQAAASALAAGFSQHPVAAPGGLDRSLVTAAVGQVFPEVARAEPFPAARSTASSFTCSASCTYTYDPNTGIYTPNQAQVLSTCAFLTDPIACTGGGSITGSGNFQITASCGNSPAAIMITNEGFQISVNFNNCSVALPNGAGNVVISNSPGQPLNLQGTAGANGTNLSGSVSATALHVNGTLCGKTVNSDCRVSYSLTFGGSPNGSFCDCVLSNLSSPDVCTAKCG